MLSYSTEEIQSGSSSCSSSAPESFYCPLTLEIMEDPVQCKETGHTFEREAIFEWMWGGNATCPLTRKPLRPADLVENEELCNAISVWKQIRDMEAKMAQITLSFPEEEVVSKESYGSYTVPRSHPVPSTATEKKTTGSCCA